MYVPNHFAVTDSGIADVLGAGGLAHLVTPTSSGLVSTPLPLLHDAAAGPRGSLVGHVARNNPHWQVKPTGDSLAIIAGPHAYISPSWYPSKHEHGRAVPTWNYAVVHVHGQLLVRDDVAWLRAHVTALTDTHEAGRDPAWRVTDAPADFVEGQLRAIVGIELQITHIEGKAKLSQNRPRRRPPRRCRRSVRIAQSKRPCPLRSHERTAWCGSRRALGYRTAGVDAGRG